jgi:hypothetical protein
MNFIIALAQIGLSALFLTGYFLVLILFMMGFSRVPVDYKEAFVGLLSLLSAGGLTILYFWFQRLRMGGVPDPVTTTITTQTPPPPAPQTTIVTMTPTGEPDAQPPLVHPAAAPDPERVPDTRP